MKKKDTGAVNKLLSMMVLMWGVLACFALSGVVRAGYIRSYLEDSLLQANLAAILIDPYHYGKTGELVFQDVEETKAVFTDFLEMRLTQREREKLGITQPAEILDFRVYEVTAERTTEFIFAGDLPCEQKQFSKEHVVTAPDGTLIENSAVYAKIAISVECMPGIEITAIKEHCVDMVSEERNYE